MSALLGLMITATGAQDARAVLQAVATNIGADNLTTPQIVVNADMYTPPKQGAPLPKPNESTRMLMQTIGQNGLDVAQHVGLHGGVGPHDDLVKIVGQPATN